VFFEEGTLLARFGLQMLNLKYGHFLFFLIHKYDQNPPFFLILAHNTAKITKYGQIMFKLGS
ncbi:MAG TPA: hypothetical protein PLO43_04420, partial [Chlamydiales bacterium]|nr:hypothetical protein [Chlamydiales bacterium]